MNWMGRWESIALGLVPLSINQDVRTHETLGGRPPTVAREPVRDAMMRSRDCCSAKQMHMTWAEDATMSEGKQRLERDVTEVNVSRRGARRTSLMFVVFFRRMLSTLQWSRLETNVSFQPTCCCSVSLPLWSVARRCCSTQVSFMS